MKRIIRTVLSATLLTATLSLNAQPGKTPVKQVIKDTFAFNILTTMDKVLRVVEDPAKHPMTMGGELLSTTSSGAGVYRSSIQFPGGETATLKSDGANRTYNISRWEWQGMIYQIPKGQQTAMLKSMEAKLDTLIKSFDSRKKPAGVEYSISVRNWYEKSWLEKDELSILISFKKKLYNTEQGAIDSILQLYRPLLSDTKTSGNIAAKFAEALVLEGIDQKKVVQIFNTEMKDIANKNLDAAFQMLVGGPFFVDVKESVLVLTPSQQNEFKTKASKIVNDFYEEQRKGTVRNDVVVEKKKELEKVKPPSDPCERAVWETGVKVGNFVDINGKPSYVSDYSCTLHTYTVAWIEKEKLQFRSGIQRDEIKKYPKSYSYPFLICSNCRGAGHIMEYDWYQMGVGSNFYARSDKQRKYTCGVCKGAGYMKVR